MCERSSPPHSPQQAGIPASNQEGEGEGTVTSVCDDVSLTSRWANSCSMSASLLKMRRSKSSEPTISYMCHSPTSAIVAGTREKTRKDLLTSCSRLTFKTGVMAKAETLSPVTYPHNSVVSYCYQVNRAKRTVQ